MNIPEYLTEDETFFYIDKEHITDIQEYEDFVPLSDLLDRDDVSNAYYNCIGQLYGKNVLVI